MFGREKLATIVAEFLGTGVLTLVVLTVYHSQVGLPYFVSIATGLVLAALILAFGKFSGAVFNPAIAVGLWSVRKLTTLATIIYVAAELLGAWAASYLFGYFVNTKLAAVGGHYNTRILVAEAVGAGILALVWAAALHQKWQRSTMAAGLGATLVVAMVLASGAGIGLINPALALGMRAWVWGTYVLGPVVGAIVAFNLYTIVFDSEGLTVLKSIKISTTTTTKKPVAAKKTAAKKPAKKAKK